MNGPFGFRNGNADAFVRVSSFDAAVNVGSCSVKFRGQGRASRHGTRQFEIDAPLGRRAVLRRTERNGEGDAQMKGYAGRTSEGSSRGLCRTLCRGDSRCWILASLILVSSSPAAWCQEWVQSFEKGLGSAKPYHGDGPAAELAIVADNSAAGQQFLRATLPGERKLEGVNVTASPLRGGRLATVSAKVRGSGEVWLCLISTNGWLYAPHTRTLTDRWQTISLSKALMARDRTLGIHFLARERQQDAVFEVDDIQVTLADPPKVSDAEVGSWRLEAEDFPLHRKNVTQDESAFGGRSVHGQQYCRLVQMPFPRTSRAVTISVRVKAASNNEEFRLITTQGGNTQFLSTAKPKAGNDWQWVRFPSALAGEVGDQFDIDVRRAKGVVEAVAIDSVVIATRADLDDARLDAAPLLFAGYPLTVVARAETLPTLDGLPDDPCWQHTVACTGFVGVRSLTPAQANTAVRLCYDDKNLYALFVCQEPILSMAQQRRHEFAAKVKQRDGDVSRDDSVIMLLDPTNTGKQVFDFTVNSLGTVADASCLGPDLWESRDLTWNSSAHAAGANGDGVWNVEVSIPFADLATKTPMTGDVWQTCLGRIARSRKETTSWNASNRGIHDPQSPGILVFAGPVPGVVMDVPTALQPGKNQVSAAITPHKKRPVDAYLLSSVTTPTGSTHSYQFTATGAVPVRVVGEFRAAEDAELQIAHGILDAATLTPLTLTGILKRTVKSTTATVTLACDGPYELFLNDELLDQAEQADTVEIKAPLQKGSNLFALRLQKGTAAVRIAAPGLDPQWVNWKVNSANKSEATSSLTDDSSWETATEVGQHPKLGRILGRPGSPVVLRHTLLWEKTRIWPTPGPALWIARNSDQHLTVIADGLPRRKLIDWTVYLAVPPEFEILGTTGYYGHVDYQPSFLCTLLAEQTVGERRMRVARITANKPIKTGRHYIFSLFNAFVRLREGQGETKNEKAFVYWTTANDGTVVEPRQSVPVRLLPALNGRQPKKLVWQLWGSFFSSMNNVAMREATLRTMQRAGLNDLVAGDRWTTDNGPEFGIKHSMGFNFQTWSLNMKPYLKEHPAKRLVDQDGKPTDGYLCTTLLLDDAWPAVEASLQEKIETVRAHTMDYDYEYSPFTGPHSCYCPRCLAEFRSFAELDPEMKLDAQIIRKLYEAKWVDFMARRVAQIFRKFKDTIHRLSPPTKFSVYSGYQTPENPKRYGVDWNVIGELQGCDRIGCGYGRPVEAIPVTIDGLRGIPALFGVLMRPYATDEMIPQVPLTKARLLRRALDATGGVLVYNRLPLDGRSWFAIAETTRLVATFEDLFLTGKRTGLADCDSACVQILNDGNRTLVCVMNGGSSSRDLRLPLPAKAGGGHEFYSGRTVSAGETVFCSLPAGEAAVFVLGE